MRYQAALRPDTLRLYRESLSTRHQRLPSAGTHPRHSQFTSSRFNATIKVDGGYSSVAERLSVAQDVEGSIPSSRPKISLASLARAPLTP